MLGVSSDEIQLEMFAKCWVSVGECVGLLALTGRIPEGFLVGIIS